MDANDRVKGQKIDTSLVNCIPQSRGCVRNTDRSPVTRSSYNVVMWRWNTAHLRARPEKQPSARVVQLTSARRRDESGKKTMRGSLIKQACRHGRMRLPWYQHASIMIYSYFQLTSCSTVDNLTCIYKIKGQKKFLTRWNSVVGIIYLVFWALPAFSDIPAIKKDEYRTNHLLELCHMLTVTDATEVWCNFKYHT